jgi:hypothetical protein
MVELRDSLVGLATHLLNTIDLDYKEWVDANVVSAKTGYV